MVASSSRRISPKFGIMVKGGQIAQSVERSPEKAGVGGSNPSLATTFPNNSQLILPLWRRPSLNAAKLVSTSWGAVPAHTEFGARLLHLCEKFWTSQSSPL